MEKTRKKRIMAMGMVAVMAIAAKGVPSAIEAKAEGVKDLKNITITKTISLGQGYKKKIVLANVPAEARITYTSKNQNIATISKKGIVTAKKTGRTVIYVKFTYNKKNVVKRCNVTVKKAVKKVQLQEKVISLREGSSYDITKKNKVTILPANAGKTVSYTSSKKSVAIVTPKGKVIAKKAGTAKITVKAQDGSEKKAVLIVTITKKTIQNVPTAEATKKPSISPTPSVTMEPGTTPSPVPTLTAIITPETTEIPGKTTEPTPSVGPTSNRQISKDFGVEELKVGPKFKATYQSGKEKIYEVDPVSLKEYYKGKTDSIAYTVTEIDPHSGEQNTEKKTVIAEEYGLFGVELKVDEFVCIANASFSTLKCNVTVTTTSSEIANLVFVDV